MTPYCCNWSYFSNFSFRVVHRLDIIPHSPPCDKDEYAPGVDANDDSKPCDPNNKERGYHHGTEIWYSFNIKKYSVNLFLGTQMG